MTNSNFGGIGMTAAVAVLETISVPRCDVCKQPAADDASMWVSYAQINANREWDQAHQGVTSIGEIMTGPAPAGWRITHNGCDGQNDYSYYLPVPRTFKALLDRVAHLMGKSWINCTDFGSFIRECSEKSGRWAS